MPIDPRGADLKRLLEEDPGGPVVMLNLLRFTDDGRVSYGDYARHLVETFLPKYGGELIYAGDGSTALVAGEGQAWDALLLIRYPTRLAFSRMVADPESGYPVLAWWATVRLPGARLRPGRACAITPGTEPDEVKPPEVDVANNVDAPRRAT
jgi:hypothetical protein